MAIAMSQDADAATELLKLCLYVAGDAPNSARARNNLQSILGVAAFPPYELEVVDCLAEPLRALNDGVIVTPTLRKLAPAPSQTIIGALTDAAKVRLALGLASADV